MIRNYLKISYRNLLKSKGYAAINIFGLAIGMACCLVILAIVYTELNYDRHHERADRIYRLAETFWEDGKIVESSASIGIPVGPVVSAAFPGVKTVRFYKTFEKIPLLRYEDKRFYEDALLFTDSTVFDIFSFPLLRGNQATALSAPFSIVLTEAMARKYFGAENPLGKTLKFENQLDFTVTGVMENLPPTSHIQFDFLASFQNLEALFKASGTSFSWDGWYWNPCHTYLLLPPDLPAERLAAQLPEFTKTHAPEWLRSKLEFFLQPLTDIHLHSNLYQELQVNGSEQSVWMFTLIALFVLLIACINFMNLATARSAQRAKEIAVRKTIGAGRAQLVWQFLGESVLLSCIAAAGAYFLATLSLPFFRETLGITLDLNLIGTTKVLGSLAVLALLAGLLAGIYPALFLSAYKPVEGLNMAGAGPVKSRSALLRKSLVVFQFCISIALLTGMLVIQRQHRFLQEKELGFDKEQLVLIPIRGTDIKQQNRIDAFKQRLTREPDVLHACALSNIVGRDVQVCPFQVEGLKDVQQIPGMFVDFDFMATFGVELKAGRAFDPTHPTDTFAFLLNEAALGQFGWQEAEGKRIRFGREGQVIGVLADFNFSKLQERIRPLAITIRPSWYSYVAVRLAPGDVPGTLGRLKKIWQEFEPERPFDAFFLDDNLNQLYEKEARLGWVFALFSVLAIIIGCLGLFGLATYAAERRVKEIGIRRVLGATVSGIVGLLSKDFLQLVLLAFLLATPLAWYGLSRWLQDFPYRIELEWWFFGLAGLAAVAIAFLTVGVQSVRAALADPVTSLRSE
ncbi:MAG: ABC transporter permease [Lewinellaceae bacterium]|nr:ABC transporter permease [Lewinellaceae bacterium]